MEQLLGLLMAGVMVVGAAERAGGDSSTGEVAAEAEAA